MAQYIEVEQAVGMQGLRVVLTPGVPGPWTEAAKGILHVKQIPFVKVRQELMGENLPLINWTRQATAPVFVYNDERPRTVWIEPLTFAERLAPEQLSACRDNGSHLRHRCRSPSTNLFLKPSRTM